MPEVKPAVELLDRYGDVIDACHGLAQIGDQYWNSIYMPLISSVVDYFQLLIDRSGEHKLFAIALESAHKSLESCVDADIKTRPKLTMFAVFSASLCQDVGQPAGDLEVTATTAEGESTLWQPAEGDRLASLGERYEQNWTLQYLPARNWSTVIAWSLLPPAGRKWLASERTVLHAWHSALLKENPNPLTNLVCYGKSNDVGTLRSAHLRNFLSYLQQQIDEGAINRPWSRIHAVDAGLFIVVPDIFRDYDLNAVRDLQSELASASFIVKATDETSRWKYCAPEAKSLRGHVLDPVKCGLELGRTRTNRILTCPQQPVASSASTRISD